jgi:hypothetical protein
MSQVIEQEYDRILTEIGSKMSKVDPSLAMETMYYERKFTDVEPQVELHAHYREGVNLDQKRSAIEAKYGFMVAKEPHGTLRMIGLMTLSTLQQISSDPDILEIDGKAYCSSY